MKVTNDRIGGAFLLLLGLFVIWERRVLPLGTAYNPGPGYFPLILALLLSVFGALLLLRRTGAAVRSISWPEAPHAVAILGCFIFMTLFMERIGYRLTMLIVLGFLFGVMERTRIWLAVALTLSFSFGTFWMFDTLLRVPLPRGGWGF
jgi:putative tricarboxylic transport membrane protein